MDTTPKRLRILAADEIQALYGRPRFTYEERLEYFSLSPKELVVLEQLHSIKSRIHFILQLGYFKARQLFVAFSLEEVFEDRRYIMEQYFPNFQFTDFEITKVTRLKHQRLILKLYNYRSCNAQKRRKLETKAQQAAMVCSKPIYIFREMMHYLQEERIVAPVYSFLQDTVGKAMTEEQNRLISIVRHHLTPSDIEALKALLSDSQGLYEITLLKREPKDYRMAEISDMEYHILAAVSDNFIRLETLSEANDRVSNDIAKLPIFQYFNIGDALHSSSDGQKFESQIPTINARYSSKYFGLKKGIVSYTLVANRIPVNAKVIGANEHESHYVFDILYNNTTDIQPEIHSTDTQGTNEVNFAILHLFGYKESPTIQRYT
jgi:hypothetical protein